MTCTKCGGTTHFNLTPEDIASLLQREQPTHVDCGNTQCRSIILPTRIPFSVGNIIMSLIGKPNMPRLEGPEKAGYKTLEKNKSSNTTSTCSTTNSLKDFIVKTEALSRNKKGKRVYLNDSQTRDLMKRLNEFFESVVEAPRIRVGKKQTIETLINEEALVLAKFLRNERNMWIPRTIV